MNSDELIKIDLDIQVKSALRNTLLKTLCLVCYQDQESQPLFDLELRLFEYEGVE